MDRIDPQGRAWVEEYLFLKAFPQYTHDLYLDADPTFVRWMLHIDNIVTAKQAEAARGQRVPGVPRV